MSNNLANQVFNLYDYTFSFPGIDDICSSGGDEGTESAIEVLYYVEL